MAEIMANLGAVDHVVVPRTHEIRDDKNFQNLTCFIVFGDGCEIYYKMARVLDGFQILNPNRKWQSEILNPEPKSSFEILRLKP